ncbi:RDD family protein [Leekyejoonella antrihumi]|uniref:RDD family protein n=1 Tax=Leekyejoonella antrihumi TaxID=1660198 RepID=A0A563DZM4_9MICO|nr:RDD family protein [Leekyejoonella antrihumi]TWP35710.1 RDD family protein [Leekyejoonella antrihumi]
MTQRASGWYDDPDNPDQLRYWDGILWTGRVMSKVKPGLEDSHLTAPPPGPSADPYAARRAPHPAAHDPYGGPERGRRPDYSNHGGSYAPVRVPTTPDGQRLSGWWRRVFALIIDNILMFLVAVAITYPWVSVWISAYQDWVNAVMTAVNHGSQRPAIPEAVLHFPWQTLAANLIVYAVYEIVLITYRGQTVGKMMTGIRVRRASTGGNPSLQESAIRFVIKQITLIGGLISVIAPLALIFTIVDYLTPLFDRLHRAIHDRGARTYVVRTSPRTKQRQG